MGRYASRSITTAGTFMGPIVAGLFYDFTKSYSVAFTIFAIVSLLATALMFLARQPGKQSIQPANRA